MRDAVRQLPREFHDTFIPQSLVVTIRDTVFDAKNNSSRSVCILYDSHNKQSLYLYTKFADWSCEWKHAVLCEVRTECYSVDELQASYG
jgi:hypothetical protein